MASCGCWAGPCALLRLLPANHALQREDFEQTVAFLASVPLFRSQLPRSELPKVAQILVQRVWQPGQLIVREGELGRAFFLVKSGTAQVITQYASCEHAQVRATLSQGDYWGGHTMLSERPNVATIVAGDGAPLVTLSMSRKAFEESGLRRFLTFPKRPAIHRSDTGLAADTAPRKKIAKTPDEEAFVRHAIHQNANLRALLHASPDKVQELVAASERKEVRGGMVLARCGELGNELFIVYKGSFDIVLESAADVGFQQSAEAAVSHSTMAERLLRKQHCLQALSSHPNLHELVTRKSAFPDTGAGSRARNPLKKQPHQGSASFKRTETRRIEPPEAAEEAASPPALGVGESFGELSLLYSMRREATFRAREDSVVFVIRRTDIASLGRSAQRLREYCELLDEVPALSPLLSSERCELARNALGIVNFRPGERIITQGKVREALQWYVVSAGCGVTTRTLPGPDGGPHTRVLAQLRRGCHFGERSLLRGEAAAETSVDAGPHGMSCLTFHGETLLLLRWKIFQGDDRGPSPDCDIEDYMHRLVRNWHLDSVSVDMPFSGREVELEDLTKVCRLGRGGFADVSLVQDAVSGRRFALKTMSKGHLRKLGAEQQISWERELLSMVDSPFITHLHRTFEDQQHIYFLFEALLGGSLMEVLHKRPEVFSEDSPRGSSMAFYCGCLVAALEHLHERRIVHRDLKPENVLLDERGYAKLCDMGFARFVLGKTNTLAGTPDYMAPEMIDFPHSHDMAVDWWALGVLAFELLAGQTPWEDEGLCEPMARLLAIRRSQEQNAVSFPFHFPKAAKDFVKKLLHKLPQRLGAVGGAAAVRKHSMFGAFRFDFEACQAQTMETPFSRPWEECHAHADEPDLSELKVEEPLGLSEDDSIFVPAAADQKAVLGG